MNSYKVDAIVCHGNVVLVYAENTNSGTKAYIAGSELQIEKLDGFIGRYKLLDCDGKPMYRILGKSYYQEGVLILLPSDEEEDNDEEESNENDGVDTGDKDDVIEGYVIEKANAACVDFAKNYEKKAKKWNDSMNKASVGIIRNTEYKKLVDVIGYHSTLDAVAKIYGGYFEDGSFKDIAADVIAMHFRSDVDMATTIKELEFRHRNE